MHKDYLFINKLYKDMHGNSNKKGNIKNIEHFFCKDDNTLNWFNYLLYTDLYYPSFKYYVFKSILNENIKLNKKILSFTYDIISNFNNKYSDNDFIKIYNYCKYKTRIYQKRKSLLNDSWKKYTDYKVFNKEFKCYNTDIGIEGINNSKKLFKDNNIDVYYLNKEPAIIFIYNKYSIVDIKITKKISILKDILLEKVSNYVNRNTYINKINNSFLLEDLYKKYAYNLFFTKEDLLFIYEIDFSMDLLVKNNYKDIILLNRNKQEDMSVIFDCSINKVGTEIKDLKKDLTVYIGDIDINIDNYPKYVIGNITLFKNNTVILPYYLKGNLIIKNNVLSDLVMPSIIIGNIDMENTKTIRNIVFPQTVSNNIYLDNLYCIINSVLPKQVNDIYLESLVSFKKIDYPENYNKIYVSEYALDNLDINKEKAIIYN